MVIIDVNNSITEYNTHWMGSSADIRRELVNLREEQYSENLNREEKE